MCWTRCALRLGRTLASRPDFSPNTSLTTAGESSILRVCLCRKGVTERMRTYVARGREAEQLKQGNNWFVVDAANQVLGRVATRGARLLIGKDNPSYTPYLNSGDHVVVINADNIPLTANKIHQKVYRHHSEYPTGLNETPI